MQEKIFRKVTYGDGSVHILNLTDWQARELQKGTNNPVTPVIVLTQAELDAKIAEARATGYEEGFETAKSIWCEI